jgi:hypothetical protein
MDAAERPLPLGLLKRLSREWRTFMPQLESLALQPARIHKPRRPIAEAEYLEAKLVRAIRRATGDRVRYLKVHLHPGRVEVRGRCGTYYCKQQVQQAVLGMIKDEPALQGEELENQIEVY